MYCVFLDPRSKGYFPLIVIKAMDEYNAITSYPLLNSISEFGSCICERVNFVARR